MNIEDLPHNSVCVVVYLNDEGELDVGIHMSRASDVDHEAYTEIETIGFGCLAAAIQRDPGIVSLGESFLQGKAFGQRYQQYLSDRSEEPPQADLEGIEVYDEDGDEHSTDERSEGTSVINLDDRKKSRKTSKPSKLH